MTDIWDLVDSEDHPLRPGQGDARGTRRLDRRTGPPTWLAALDSRLVEEIAHGEDIRRPLGLVRDYPVESVVPAIRYQASTKDAFGGPKALAERVTLVADDADLRLGAAPRCVAPRSSSSCS